jgi:DNA-binding Lrp family transcriptional regulator
MMTVAYFLINSEMGAEEQVLKDLKALPEVKEAHGVYGVYDMVIKIEGETTEDLKNIVASKIRKNPRIRSTLTMIVV